MAGRRPCTATGSTSGTGSTWTTTAPPSTPCSAAGSEGEIYNIGAGVELTNRALADRLLALAGAGPEMVEYVDDRLGHDRRYAVDSSKVRALGWEPKRSLDEALDGTFNWYRDNRWWWEPLKVASWKPPVKILITGAAGQLGTDLTRMATEDAHHQVVAADRARLDVGRQGHGARGPDRASARPGCACGGVDGRRRL